MKKYHLIYNLRTLSIFRLSPNYTLKDPCTAEFLYKLPCLDSPQKPHLYHPDE